MSPHSRTPLAYLVNECLQLIDGEDPLSTSAVQCVLRLGIVVVEPRKKVPSAVPLSQIIILHAQ